MLAPQDQQLSRDATLRDPLDAKDTVADLWRAGRRAACAQSQILMKQTMSDDYERGAFWRSVTHAVVMGGVCDAGAEGHAGRVRESRVWGDLGASGGIGSAP